MAKQPILDLDTLTERELVAIKTPGPDGGPPIVTNYEMRNAGEVGIVEWNRIQRGFARMGEIGEKLKTAELGSDGITDEELQDLDDITRKTVASVLIGIGPEVLTRLSLSQCQKIVATFIEGRRAPQAPAADEEVAAPETNPPTGESSSPVS